jgi:methyl-accepting chemotaxis protein
MTIKFKLLLISGGIAIAMLLSIASMYWSVNTINSLTKTQNINQQLLSNMLMLRRNEKDFLLRNDLKYLDKYNKNFIIMQENISQLSVLLNSNNITIDNYDSLSTIMNTYRSRFHQLVDLSKQIGLNPKSGQRGSLRASVHKAESIFKEMSNYKLLKDMLMLRRNEKDFLMRKNAKYIDKFNNNFQIFITDINDSDIDDTIKDTLLKHVGSYKKDFLQLSVLTEKKGFGPKLGLLGEMRHTIHQSEDLLKQMNSQIEETIQSMSDSIQTMNLIISLVIALVIISFTLFSAQTIIRSLAGFLETLKEVSHTGNLALRVDVQGNDEISEVGVTLNKMLSEFQEIVQRLQIASADLSEYSQQFMSIRTNTFNNVEKQQLETEQVSIAMTELSTSARNIAQNTTLTAEASKQANTISNEGKSIVDSSIHSTQSLESVINNASHVIQKLGEDSNSIGGILEVIRGIAEQTNLLALNAAIEAARAGEQGRGFAVVADEVRTLAQKTQDSISEIEAMISSLQNGSNMAIEAITQGKDGVTSNVKQIGKAGDSLVTIVTELNSINQMSQENVVATEAQSAVAEDVNKSVLAIKELGSLMVENIEQLKQSGDKISTLSTDMEEMVKRFHA